MNIDRHDRPLILLVDDVPANLDILVSLLKELYELRVATRGVAALEAVKLFPKPDLILLDVMMPDMDGYEVCRRLQSDEETADIPVIFLTALGDRDNLMAGFAAGAVDYVSKPFSICELLARVKTHLTIRRQQQQIHSQNDELKTLLHVISHDLNNHLGAIIMALESSQLLPGKKLEDYREFIEQSAETSINLIACVQEIRKLETGKLPLIPVNVQESLQRVLMLFSQAAGKKEIRLNLNASSLDVMAENNILINSIFGNILSNAIKFTPRQGEIQIVVESHEKEVMISFRDQGIGIPVAILKNVFDLRTSSSRPGTENEKGNGFGLPIARKFVALLGGRLEVESRCQNEPLDDHGTEFRIFLQAANC